MDLFENAKHLFNWKKEEQEIIDWSEYKKNNSLLQYFLEKSYLIFKIIWFSSMWEIENHPFRYLSEFN